MQRLDGWIPQDVAKEPSQLRLWARAAAGGGGGVGGWTRPDSIQRAFSPPICWGYQLQSWHLGP